MEYQSFINGIMKNAKEEKKMKKWLVILLLFWAVPAIAADISFQTGMTQQYFKDFSKDAAGVLLYRAVAPAEPLGLTGFDIGLEMTATSMDNAKDYMKKSFKDQNPPSYIFAPKIHAQKGLPFGIDVGLVYSEIPGTNIQYIGGEVKYAIISGGVLLPALAIRGSYTQLMGVTQLDFKTYGLEVTASKGFGVGLKIIPYASIGQHWADSTPKSLPAGVQLNNESFSLTRCAVGAKLQMLLFALTAEVDYVQALSYTLRAGITW
jgi:hypothetical protein